MTSAITTSVRSVIASIALLCFVCACPCQAKPPRPPAPIAPFSIPAAVMPGSAVDVKFTDMPGEPLGLWTAFPSRSTPSTTQNKPGEAKFRITLSADVPVGIYAVRPMTSAGISHIRLLMVDDLPTILREHGNTTPKDAQSVSLPIAIDGGCEPAAAHYYRIAAKKGQRLSAEAVAQRIGSQMDPMMRLLDAAGRELAYCDDSPGAGSDCRFMHNFAADGDYYIEIRDVNYEGGPGYRYHLRLGDFPLVSSTSPLAGLRATSAMFHLLGEGCENLADVPFSVPNDSARAWLKVKYPDGQGSALVPVLCTDLLESILSNSTGHPDHAGLLTLPTAIDGQFARPGEAASFEFLAKEHDRISIHGQTRAIGSMATLSLQLLDSTGQKIAEIPGTETPSKKSKKATLAPSNGPDDGTIIAIILSTGTYRLVARELAGAAGPGMFYRLEIRPLKPGFTLSVDSEIASAAPGESFKIKVIASRRNYTGPINLSLTGDAQSFKTSHAEIPAGKSDVELEIAIPADQSKSQPLSFAIIGQGTIGDARVIEKASTHAALMKLFPRIPYPPPEMDGLIGLGIR